jgi:hypothetical protein
MDRWLIFYFTHRPWNGWWIAFVASKCSIHRYLQCSTSSWSRATLTWWQSSMYDVFLRHFIPRWRPRLTIIGLNISDRLSSPDLWETNMYEVLSFIVYNIICLWLFNIAVPSLWDEWWLQDTIWPCLNLLPNIRDVQVQIPETNLFELHEEEIQDMQ